MRRGHAGSSSSAKSNIIGIASSQGAFSLQHIVFPCPHPAGWISSLFLPDPARQRQRTYSHIPNSHQGQRLAIIHSDIYSQSHSDQPRPECVSEVQHGSQHLAVSLRLKAPYCAINRGDNLPARPCLSSRTDRATTCWGVCIRARERCVSTGWYWMGISIATGDDGVRPRNSVLRY